MKRSSPLYLSENPFQTPKPSVKLNSLKNSTSEKICALRRSPLSVPNADYIQVMLDLSKEQGFEVTYFNIGEKTSLSF